ncbi:MAG: RidA family protein [Bdellovibrionota bacterium]|nr:MAG: RidA family protein [Bdellovibrionota bacterium]
MAGQRRFVSDAPNAPSAIGPYSQAVDLGDFVFLSGQIPIDPATGKLCAEDIEAQTRQVLKNIGAVLQHVGLDYSHVVKTTIFLSDLSHFQTVNGLYGQVFSEYKPARSTVQVAALPMGAKVEIEVLARR